VPDTGIAGTGVYNQGFSSEIWRVLRKLRRTMSADVLRFRQQDLVCREVGENLIGLDLRSSQYFSLNDTGTELWRMLEHGTTIAALAELLVQAHDLDLSVATSDVEAFVASLRDQGLLE
jgi:hypothetical protein